MAQIVAAASGNAGAGSTWVGGTAPVDGDSIQIPAGIQVVQNVPNRIYGSKAAATFHGVDIMGASAGSFGELVVPDAITMTLRGFDNDDTGGPYNMRIRNWGKFSPQPGSTILLDVASDGAGVLANEGIINAIGTAAKRITFGIPAANKNWNTAHSYDFSFAGYRPYNRARNIACAFLGAPCIANAAGTGSGSFGDSSVVFSGVTPAGILTTPVASIALVTSAGKYFVDHQGGYVFYYTTQADGSTAGFHVAAKKLSIIGCRIRTKAGIDGNQAIYRYATFDSLGTHSGGAIEGHSLDQTTGTRKFEATNCIFQYGYAIRLVNGIVANAANPTKLDDNEYIGMLENDYSSAVTVSIGSYPYLSIQRSKHRLSRYAFIHDYFADGADTASIYDNVSWTASVISKDDRSKRWNGADIRGNAMLGRGGMDDARMVHSLHGTLATPTQIRENLIYRAQRGVGYAEYNDLDDNVIMYAFHHSVMAQDAIGEGVTMRPRLRRNLVVDAGESGALEMGYNYDNLQDGPEEEHNTIYQSQFASTFGDQTDTTGMQQQLNYKKRSNLLVANGVAVRRLADTSLNGSRVHLAAQDYHNIYGSTTADFSGTFPRFCTPSGIVNVAGVSLHSPSFSAPVSGKTLALVVASSTSRTLSWDGGAAVQLFVESGAVSAAEANQAWPDCGFLNDSSKAWPGSKSQYNNAGSPVGRWVLMTSGAAAGQMRKVLTNTSGSRLIVAYGWGAALAPGDTYQIWRSEVTLSNAGGTATINAGIDWRVFPTTSQSDNAVSIAFNGKAVDPQFVDPTRNLETWDASLGGPGTEDGAIARLYADPTLTRTSLLPYIKAGFAPTNAAIATAAHDGTTIGAVPWTLVADHLWMDTQPSAPTGSGVPHAVQPAVSIKEVGGATVATDNTTIVTATLVVESGVATPIGTLTKVAVAGIANFAANGLGGTSPTGAMAHWLFTAPGLTSISSASFFIPAAPAVALPMPLLVNGVDVASLGFVLAAAPGWMDTPPRALTAVVRPGRAGTYPVQVQEQPRRVTLSGVFKGATAGATRALIDTMKALVLKTQPAQLVLPDAQTRYVRGYLAGFVVDPGNGASMIDRTLGARLDFDLADPYAYDLTPTALAAAVAQVAPLGTAPSRPVVTFAFAGAVASVVLTVTNAANTVTYATLTLTGPFSAGQTLVVDMDALSVTLNGASRLDLITAGDFFTLDVATMGDYASSTWPTVRAGVAFALSYRKAWR